MPGKPRLTKEELEAIWLPDGFTLLNYEEEYFTNSRGRRQRVIIYNIRCPAGHLRRSARPNVLQFPGACQKCSGRGYTGPKRRKFHRKQAARTILREADGRYLRRCERCFHAWRTEEGDQSCPKCTNIK